MNKILFTFLWLISETLLLYSKTSPVILLKQLDFKKRVLDSNQIWIVEFFAPWCGHCKQLAPEYEKAAKILKGIINVGAVDMTTDQQVGQPYGIKGFPTIKIFSEDKNHPIDYSGERKSKPIIDFAFSTIKNILKKRLEESNTSQQQKNSKNQQTNQKQQQDPHKSKDVFELTDSNFKQTVIEDKQYAWMVIFYAPWCGHCKAALPEWNQASKEIKKSVKFGKVDCTKHQTICNSHNVKGYPTIKSFVNGKDSTYDQARNKSAFLDYANSLIVSTPPPPPQAPKFLVELINQQIYDDYCKSQKICIISFLPNFEDSTKEKRKEYLSELYQLLEKNKNNLNFIWSEGGQQTLLEESFGLGFGFPSMVAVFHSRQKLSVMRAKYNMTSIEKFIGDVLSGNSQMNVLKEEKIEIKYKKMSSEEL